MIKERLANNWVILEFNKECYTCGNNNKIGKFIFDLFICSSCVEELGGGE